MSRKEIKSRARIQLGNNIFANNWLLALVVVLLGSAISGAASTVVIGSIIVMGPISYGMSKLFLKQARDNQAMDIVGMFDGFKDDFGGTLLLGLLQTIFICLWSLLFVIPGIVKSYSYAMSYNIKVDNPTLGWKECIDESRKMMKGNKWKLFVLDLSFIGWYIVGALCLGVGTLWVYPYHEAARTQFYRSLKGEA